MTHALIRKFQLRQPTCQPRRQARLPPKTEAFSSRNGKEFTTGKGFIVLYSPVDNARNYAFSRQVTEKMAGAVSVVYLLGGANHEKTEFN